MKTNWQKYLFPCLLIVAVFAAYSNVYGFAYLYDDEFLIQKNRFLNSFDMFFDIFGASSTGGAGFTDSFYRPLQSVSYLLMHQIFGHENWVYHLLNISLHAINAILVYALGRRLQISRVAAFAVALVWALHPLHTEAVTYMSATADPMHTLFILAALIVMLPDFVYKKIILGLLFFMAALLSKEAALVFPALVFSILFLTGKNRWHWRNYVPSFPFWIVGGIYLGLRATVLNFNGDLSMYKASNVYTEHVLYRFYTFLATLPHYVALLVWPADLHMDRAFSVYTDPMAPVVLMGLGLFLIAGVLILRAWILRKSGKGVWPAWACLWMAAAYAPSSGIFIPANSFFLEHWVYLPSIGFVLALGKGIDVTAIAAPKLNRALISAAILIAGALGYATYEHNWVWETPISFFSNILKYNPNADRVRHNLAMAYSDLGQNDKALEQYEIVLKHTDQYPQTLHNVGRIYLLKGEFAKAEDYEQRALKLDPKFFPAYGSLVEIYTKQGKQAEANAALIKLRELQK